MVTLQSGIRHKHICMILRKHTKKLLYYATQIFCSSCTYQSDYTVVKMLSGDILYSHRKENSIFFSNPLWILTSIGTMFETWENGYIYQDI